MNSEILKSLPKRAQSNQVPGFNLSSCYRSASNPLMSFRCFSLAMNRLCSTRAAKSMPRFCMTHPPGCFFSISGGPQSSATPVLLSFFLLSAIKHKSTPGFPWALLRRTNPQQPFSPGCSLDAILMMILPSGHFWPPAHVRYLITIKRVPKSLSTEIRLQLIHNLRVTAIQGPAVYSSSTVWWK